MWQSGSRDLNQPQAGPARLTHPFRRAELAARLVLQPRITGHESAAICNEGLNCVCKNSCTFRLTDSQTIAS